MPEFVAYDEFAYFHENAEEFGLPYRAPPVVRARVRRSRGRPPAECLGVGWRRSAARVSCTVAPRTPTRGTPSHLPWAGRWSAWTSPPRSFDELLERTILFDPTRSVASLRRGILHNAVQQEDGSWVWRHARHRSAVDAVTDVADQFSGLWDAISNLRVPLMLARGMRDQSVVDDADEAELLRRCPGARVEHVEEAGHSLQGDTPLELAALIDDFVPPPS